MRSLVAPSTHISVRPPGGSNLLFGASGSLGRAIMRGAARKFTPVTRKDYDFRFPNKTDGLVKYDNISTIIWCNGLNTNDTLETLDEATYDDVMNVNIHGIVKTLSFFMKEGKIMDDARLCIVSSILQDYGRANKLSYAISKSAIRGLVNTSALELKPHGVCINAILPGPIENDMTRSTISETEYERLRDSFTDPSDVVSMCNLLCFNNQAITGQFFTVDNGLTGHITY